METEKSFITSQTDFLTSLGVPEIVLGWVLFLGFVITFIVVMWKKGLKDVLDYILSKVKKTEEPTLMEGVKSIIDDFTEDYEKRRSEDLKMLEENFEKLNQEFKTLSHDLVEAKLTRAQIRESFQNDKVNTAELVEHNLIDELYNKIIKTVYEVPYNDPRKRILVDKLDSIVRSNLMLKNKKYAENSINAEIRVILEDAQAQVNRNSIPRNLGIFQRFDEMQGEPLRGKIAASELESSCSKHKLELSSTYKTLIKSKLEV